VWQLESGRSSAPTSTNSAFTVQRTKDCVRQLTLWVGLWVGRSLNCCSGGDSRREHSLH
jgi:hypothetical protein